MTPSGPCPFCGNETEAKGVCQRRACQEASARIPLGVKDSRGVPELRKGWQTTPEYARRRRPTNVRMRPDVKARLAAIAKERGMTVAALVESWVLAPVWLPDDSDVDTDEEPFI